MEEATIVDYSVKLGDKVKKGDIIFEAETDKASLEIESPADGFVKYVLADLGQTLLVGDVVLILGEKDEEIDAGSIKSLKAASKSPPEDQTPQTKPADKITENDIKKAVGLKSLIPDVKLGATIPVSRLQRITAQRMLRSKREIPCYYLTAKADVTDLVEFRTRLNETSDIKLSYNDFIMRAAAIGLEKFPIMTGRLVGESIQLADSINIGLAVSVPNGLVVPVVKNVRKKNIVQIARESRALVEKAINNKLSLTDLEGGCITISNLGAFGAESNTAIVMPGQCSVLGIGRIIDTCMPENDNIIVRKLMTMTLSVDHKIANGSYASQFLDLVRKLLEETSNFA